MGKIKNRLEAMKFLAFGSGKISKLDKINEELLNDFKDNGYLKIKKKTYELVGDFYKSYEIISNTSMMGHTLS